MQHMHRKKLRRVKLFLSRQQSDWRPAYHSPGSAYNRSADLNSHPPSQGVNAPVKAISQRYTTLPSNIVPSKLLQSVSGENGMEEKQGLVRFGSSRSNQVNSAFPSRRGLVIDDRPYRQFLETQCIMINHRKSL
jgi:hypothetical protein